MADNSKSSKWPKIIAAMAVLGIVGKCVNPDPPPVSPKVEAPKEKEKETECEKTDLQCRGEKARFAATPIAAGGGLNVRKRVINVGRPFSLRRRRGRQGGRKGWVEDAAVAISRENASKSRYGLASCPYAR